MSSHLADAPIGWFFNNTIHGGKQKSTIQFNKPPNAELQPSIVSEIVLRGHGIRDNPVRRCWCVRCICPVSCAVKYTMDCALPLL